jgi:hypothetical protein
MGSKRPLNSVPETVGDGADRKCICFFMESPVETPELQTFRWRFGHGSPLTPDRLVWEHPCGQTVEIPAGNLIGDGRGIEQPQERGH